MNSLNRIGTQNTIQNSNEQLSNINEKAAVSSIEQTTVFEQIKAPGFLDKALATSSTAESTRKELLTEHE